MKQYFKLERALRTETTINNANDFGVGKRLSNLDRLRAIGRNVNHRLLSLECVAQHCAIASQTVERIVLPTVDEDEHRAPALRWGDPRVMALVVRVAKSHRYMLTTQGRKIALFMTKSYVRVVRPIFQRLLPQLPEDAPGPLRRAWKACEMEIDKVVTEARLAA